MSETQRFCIKCRWWRGLADSAQPDVIVQHLCTQPSVTGPHYDLVTGAELPRGQHTCSVQRMALLGMCGPLGTLWEAKI